MNAMQTASRTSPKTIGELQQYLAQLEANWTETDTEYLGEFKSLELYVATDKGIATAHLELHSEFGLIAFINK